MSEMERSVKALLDEQARLRATIEADRQRVAGINQALESIHKVLKGVSVSPKARAGAVVPVASNLETELTRRVRKNGPRPGSAAAMVGAAARWDKLRAKRGLPSLLAGIKGSKQVRPRRQRHRAKCLGCGKGFLAKKSNTRFHSDRCNDVYYETHNRRIYDVTCWCGKKTKSKNPNTKTCGALHAAWRRWGKDKQVQSHAGATKPTVLVPGDPIRAGEVKP